MDILINIWHDISITCLLCQLNARNELRGNQLCAKNISAADSFVRERPCCSLLNISGS